MTPTQKMIEAGCREAAEWRRDMLCEPGAVEAIYLAMEAARLQSGSPVSEALRQIAEQDDVELALDPQWAKRIAIAALQAPAAQPTEKD